MTTPAREALYLAQHRVEHEGRGWIVHNPEDKPVHELPIIYGFNNGGSLGWYSAVALAEDGTCLGGHCCSHEGYMEADLGVIEGWRMDRHEGYRKHYPAGYRMVFVGFEEAKTHEGLQAAIKRYVPPAQPEGKDALR